MQPLGKKDFKSMKSKVLACYPGVTFPLYHLKDWPSYIEGRIIFELDSHSHFP